MQRPGRRHYRSGVLVGKLGERRLVDLCDRGEVVGAVVDFGRGELDGFARELCVKVASVRLGHYLRFEGGFDLKGISARTN
jgi:hypothetical protein